jgi:D-alanyl-D-alanine carboxypeptidase
MLSQTIKTVLLIVCLLGLFSIAIFAQSNAIDDTTQLKQIEQLRTFLQQHNLAPEKTSDIPKIDSLLNYLAKHDKFMGSVSMVKNGKLIYSQAFGYAVLNDKQAIKATRKTKYRIGAISETFTATMFTKLHTIKKLRQNLLVDFYPGIKHSDEITLSDLMTHRSGIPNFVNDSLYNQYYTQAKTFKEMLAIIKKYPFELNQIGETAYSPANYFLLGGILQKLTHNNYSTDLKMLICQRINLQDTYYSETIRHNLNEASSYKFQGGKWVEQSPTHLSIYGAGGGIVSSSDDLAFFMSHLFSGKIISCNCLHLDLTEEDRVAGLMSIPFYDKQGYGYTGNIDGFSSAVCHFPDDSLSVAICSNGMNYNKNDILIGILSLYYNKPYQFPTFQSIDIALEQLKSYEGTYSHKDFPLKVNIQVMGDKLTAQATGQERFELYPTNTYEFRHDASDITITFVKNRNTMVLKQGKGAINMKKDLNY